LITILGVLLTACGGGEEPTAEPAPTAEQPVEDSAEEEIASPTDTPEPAPTDTPEPPPTEEPEPEVELTRFESAEAGYAIQYPAGWFTDGMAEFMTFASAEELLDSPDPGEEGGVVLVVVGTEGDFDDPDPVAILQQMTDEIGMVEEEGMEVVQAPTAVTLNGNDGATTSFKGTTDSGTPLSAYITVAKSGGQVIVMVAATPSATESEFQPIFEAMANSIEIFEPVAPPPPESGGTLLYGTTQTGSVTAAGPAAWDFIGLEGETIDIIVRPLADDFDVIFDLIDESGNSVLDIEVDESFGTEELRSFTLPASGTYIISIYGFGGSTGDYELTLAEAGTMTGTAGSISYGDLMVGAIASTETASWTFNGAEGDFVDITVTPYEFDLVVDVLDPSGLSILDEGPVDDSFDTEFIRVLFLPETGTYTIAVSGYEGEVGDYEVMVNLSNGGLPGSILFAADTLEEAETIEGHAFPFTALTGEIVTFHVNPELGFDTVVQIINDDTDEILDEIDYTTGFEEVIFSVPEDGNYYFLVLGFEGAYGEYDATLLGSDYVIFELAYGDGVIGRFGPDGVIDYIFRGTAGDSVTFTAETNDELDLMMTMTDLDDNLILSIDEYVEGGTETLTYTFTEDLVVFLTVSEFNAMQGQFLLFVDSE
jgi:hypothetical protein